MKNYIRHELRAFHYRSAQAILFCVFFLTGVANADQESYLNNGKLIRLLDTTICAQKTSYKQKFSLEAIIEFFNEINLIDRDPAFFRDMLRIWEFKDARMDEPSECIEAASSNERIRADISRFLFEGKQFCAIEIDEREIRNELLALIESTDRYTQISAIYALGRARFDEDIELLANIIRKGPEHLRMAAVSSLSAMHTDVAWSRLRELHQMKIPGEVGERLREWNNSNGGSKPFDDIRCENGVPRRITPWN